MVSISLYQLVQLIEHPILRIPNILFGYLFEVFFQIEFLIYNQNSPKNANVTHYIKKETTLQYLKLGKLKFGIRKIGCSMS